MEPPPPNQPEGKPHNAARGNFQRDMQDVGR